MTAVHDSDPITVDLEQKLRLWAKKCVFKPTATRNDKNTTIRCLDWIAEGIFYPFIENRGRKQEIRRL